MSLSGFHKGEIQEIWDTQAEFTTPMLKAFLHQISAYQKFKIFSAHTELCVVDGDLHRSWRPVGKAKLEGNGFDEDEENLEDLPVSGHNARVLQVLDEWG